MLYSMCFKSMLHHTTLHILLLCFVQTIKQSFSKHFRASATLYLNIMKIYAINFLSTLLLLAVLYWENNQYTTQGLI